MSRLGDIWILGKHCLLCGDARDQAAYEQLLTDDKAELVVTDPPYNVAIDGHVSGKGSICHREFVMASGEMTKEAFTEFLTDVFGRLANNTTAGSIHYTFMDWRHVDEMMAPARSLYRSQKSGRVGQDNAGMGPSIAASMSWCSCGSRDAPLKNLNSGSTDAIAPTCGTTPASTRCVPVASRNWHCTPP